LVDTPPQAASTGIATPSVAPYFRTARRETPAGDTIDPLLRLTIGPPPFVSSRRDRAKSRGRNVWGEITPGQAARAGPRSRVRGRSGQRHSRRQGAVRTVIRRVPTPHAVIDTAVAAPVRPARI